MNMYKDMNSLSYFYHNQLTNILLYFNIFIFITLIIFSSFLLQKSFDSPLKISKSSLSVKIKYTINEGAMICKAVIK